MTQPDKPEEIGFLICACNPKINNRLWCDWHMIITLAAGFAGGVAAGFAIAHADLILAVFRG